jgi:hypothetical protein
MLAIIEELLARNLVVLDRVDADFFERDPLAGGFGSDIQGEVDGELVGTVEEGPANLFALDGFVGLPDLGLLDDRRLTGGFLTAAFDGNNVRRVHRAHDVKILALVTQLYKLPGDGLKAHGELLSKRIDRSTYPIR